MGPNRKANLQAITVEEMTWSTEMPRSWQSNPLPSLGYAEVPRCTLLPSKKSAMSGRRHLPGRGDEYAASNLPLRSEWTGTPKTMRASTFCLGGGRGQLAAVKIRCIAAAHRDLAP